MTKEGGVAGACCLDGVARPTGLRDLDTMTLLPYLLSPLLLAPLSAHFSSCCFTTDGYPKQHPTFPALCMYLHSNL